MAIPLEFGTGDEGEKRNRRRCRKKHNLSLESAKRFRTACKTGIENRFCSKVPTVICGILLTFPSPSKCPPPDENATDIKRHANLTRARRPAVAARNARDTHNNNNNT